VSGGYQMTGAFAIPGGALEVGYDGGDVVMLVPASRTVRLTREAQEWFARLFLAACHQADASLVDKGGEVPR
jgi:hypothetical protein